MLDIYLSGGAPVALLSNIFDACVKAHGLRMGLYYWYICFLIQRENYLVVQKLLDIALSCT